MSLSISRRRAAMFLIISIRFFGSLHSRKSAASASNCIAKVRNDRLSIISVESHARAQNEYRADTLKRSACRCTGFDVPDVPQPQAAEALVANRDRLVALAGMRKRGSTTSRIKNSFSEFSRNSCIFRCASNRPLTQARQRVEPSENFSKDLVVTAHRGAPPSGISRIP